MSRSSIVSSGGEDLHAGNGEGPGAIASKSDAGSRAARARIVRQRNPVDSPASVLVADPSIIVCEGLVAIVSRQTELRVVGLATSGEAAAAQFSQMKPDVIVLGARFADIEPAALIEALGSVRPAARILVISPEDDAVSVQSALMAGAHGYLSLDTSSALIAQAVRTVCFNASVLSEPISRRLMEYLTHERLTPRELQILRLICATGPNLAIGRALNIEERTVKTHMTKLLPKLGAGDRTQAVLTALRWGLVKLD